MNRKVLFLILLLIPFLFSLAGCEYLSFGWGGEPKKITDLKPLTSAKSSGSPPDSPVEWKVIRNGLSDDGFVVDAKFTNRSGQIMYSAEIVCELYNAASLKVGYVYEDPFIGKAGGYADGASSTIQFVIEEPRDKVAYIKLKVESVAY